MLSAVVAARAAALIAVAAQVVGSVVLSVAEVVTALVCAVVARPLVQLEVEPWLVLGSCWVASMSEMELPTFWMLILIVFFPFLDFARVVKLFPNPEHQKLVIGRSQSSWPSP